MIPVDRAGNFRASIVDYGLVEEQSGAIAISIQVKLLEIWNADAQEWQGWAEYNMEAHGKIYVIKKDKTVNKGQAEALMKYAGWDGLFDTIANHQWEVAPFSCNIEEDTYQDKTRFKIGFINDYNRTPGAFSNVNSDKARELQSQFGAGLRAIAGTIKRGSTPTNGAPPSPPPASKPVAMAEPPLREGDIPF
jgi:hypothetical protein